ncbi:MAG: PQQ-binding-like beta-propeller repeat protein [Rickettsiaceae bacterium]|nr:PQQ-binding-like beta-propeller repeat protein [Rickettsiaceae bacterium]
MKKYLVVALSSIIIACSGPKKTMNIVEFTTQLTPNSSRKVSSTEFRNVRNFGNMLDYINSHSGIELEDIQNIRYSKTTSFSGKLQSIPLNVDKYIYTLTQDGKVYSFDLEAKKLAWQTSIDPKTGASESGSISYSEGYLYVVSDLYIYKIDASAGKIREKALLDDITRDYPLISNKVIYIKTASNKMAAYRTSDLVQIWHYQTWSDNVSTSTYSSPLIDGNSVFAGFSTGQVISSNIADGSEIWQINLTKDSSDPLGSSPADLSTHAILNNHNLYLPSSSGFLIKLAISNAGLVWKTQAEDIISMTLAGDLFITNNARQLASISSQDGSVIWTTNLLKDKENVRDAKSTIFTPPLVSNLGIFVFGRDGVGYLVNRQNGDMIKKFSIPNKVSSFIVYKGKVILFDEKSAYELIQGKK